MRNGILFESDDVDDHKDLTVRKMTEKVIMINPMERSYGNFSFILQRQSEIGSFWVFRAIFSNNLT
jgi:hypothetical protein